jgi:hypothetical protein
VDVVGVVAALLARDDGGSPSVEVGVAAIVLGPIWVILGLGLLRGVIQVPPPGWQRLGWRLPTTERGAVLLVAVGAGCSLGGVLLLLTSALI